MIFFMVHLLLTLVRVVVRAGSGGDPSCVEWAVWTTHIDGPRTSAAGHAPTYGFGYLFPDPDPGATSQGVTYLLLP